MAIPERELFLVLRELRQFLSGEWQCSEPLALKDALDKLFERAEHDARAPLPRTVVELIHSGRLTDAVHALREAGGCSIQTARAYVNSYANAIAGKT
jgi:hypothetical protein